MCDKQGWLSPTGGGRVVASAQIAVGGALGSRSLGETPGLASVPLKQREIWVHAFSS